jgi:hypothetical protein
MRVDNRTEKHALGMDKLSSIINWMHLELESKLLTV